MKTVTASPELAQLAQDWVVANPMLAAPVAMAGLMVAVIVWDRVWSF